MKLSDKIKEKRKSDDNIVVSYNHADYIDMQIHAAQLEAEIERLKKKLAENIELEAMAAKVKALGGE